MTPIQQQILAVLERFIEAHKASSELRSLIPSDAPVDHEANELIIELHHTVMVLEDITTHYVPNTYTPTATPNATTRIMRSPTSPQETTI